MNTNERKRSIYGTVGATIYLETDIRCNIYIFDRKIPNFTVERYGYSILRLPKGQYKLAFVNTENPADRYDMIFDVYNDSMKDVIEIKLSEIRAERIKKEQEIAKAEAKRKAEEEALRKQQRYQYLLRFSDSEFVKIKNSSGKKYGFALKHNNEVIVEPIYDEVHNFQNRLALVKQYKEYGWIDIIGDVIIPIKYDYAEDFCEGVALVRISTEKEKLLEVEKLRKIEEERQSDMRNKGIIFAPFKPYTYTTYEKTLKTHQDDISNNLPAEIKHSLDNKDKFGFIDNRGNKVIDYQYDDAKSFSEGLAAVKLYGKWSFINKNGDTIIRTNSARVESFYGGLAGVMQNNKWGFIDKTGNLVIPCVYDVIQPFIEEITCVQKRSIWIYIDKKGQKLFSTFCDDAKPFSEGLAAIRSNGRWGFIDKSRQLVIPYKFHEIIGYGFNSGVVEVELYGNKFYIDKTGKYIKDAD